MIVQPPPKSKSRLHAILTQEWAHWLDIPISTLCWLLLLSVIALIMNPLLPPVAYLLQLWAGSSWAWRDRWASVRMWARQGGWCVGWLCILALLAQAHLWFFPTLIALAQNAWRTYLPGELALSPTGTTLLARIILFFPLAPTLTLLYERIHPRTQVDLQRVLIPSDLAKPAAPSAASGQEQAQTSQQTTAPSSPTNTTATSPTVPATKKRSRTTQAKSYTTPASDAEQMTIDSYLAQEQAQTTSTKPKRERTTRSSGTAARKKKQQDGEQATSALTPISQGETSPAQQQPETINWDDVAE